MGAAAEVPADQVTVVIVDDHTIVREGLRSILELETGITVVGEAADSAAALRVIPRSRPDVVILDLKLGHDAVAGGLELLTEIGEQFPEVGVVVLTTFDDQELVMEALRRGARGYTVKDVDVVDLVRVIRAVRSGQSGFDSRSAAHVTRAVRAGPGAQPSLTSRELEIIRLLAQGLTNRQIGETRFISESTVKFHLRQVMTKLGVRSRAEVVYAATQLGIL
jgi:DNA-binding NarL/FixJ family response regulator